MIRLDETRLRERLAPLLEGPELRAALDNLAADPFFVAFFLVSVSQGEGLGEKAVGMIGQEQVASLLHGLARQEAEERGHKQMTLDAARELFPEYFDAGRYRWSEMLEGVTYYVAVLEANREALRVRGRDSRLNRYLTTTLAYEIMVVLLYRAVADAVARSELPPDVRGRVVSLIERILDEEEGHLGIVEQHNALLAADRSALGDEARDLLERLGDLEEDDYARAAEIAVREVARTMSRYADPQGYRRRIEAGVRAAS